MRRLSLIHLALATLAFGAGAESLAIVGGTVHPVTAEPFVGTVVVDGGVITAVGSDVAVPAGATTIDATGLHVYPGLMDAFGEVGLVEVSAVSATDDRAEMGMYNPHLDAAFAVHPASELFGVTRANGVTHGIVSPRTDRDGVIAGRASLMQFDGWTVEEMAVERSAAMVLSWPEIVTRRFDFATFSVKESPYNDAKEEAEKKQNELRDWFDAARQYRQAMQIDRPRAGRDLKLAHLAACLDGGLRVVIQANSKRDIEAAIAFAEKENLRLILAGCREGWKMAATIAEKKIPVILGAVQTTAEEDDDPYDTPYRNASVLVEAGVQIAFGSFGSAHSARLLPHEADMAVAFGLSSEVALKALTLWPAQIFGVEDRLGSIETGKIATLIVSTGDPLTLESTVVHLLIDGHEVSTENRHLALYEKYRSRPMSH